MATDWSEFEKLLALYDALRRAGKSGAAEKLNQIIGFKSHTVTFKTQVDPQDNKKGYAEFKKEVSPGGVMITRFLTDIGPEKALRLIEVTYVLKNMKDDTSAAAKATKDWIVNFFEKSDIMTEETLAKAALGSEKFDKAVANDPLRSLREEAIREAASDNDPGTARRAYTQALANFVNQDLGRDPPHPGAAFGNGKMLGGNGRVIDVDPEIPWWAVKKQLAKFTKNLKSAAISIALGAFCILGIALFLIVAILKPGY